MSAQAPVRPLHPAVKVLAGLLVLCTLTALWVTAARIKANKMAVRYGIGTENAPGDREGSQIRLHRGQSVNVQHLRLLYSGDALEVRDAQDRIRARYFNLVRGRRLGWQELQVTLLEAAKDELLIESEFVPGAASFGGGVYYELRAGLRVEFRGDRAFTLATWNPSTEEGKVKIEEGARSEDHSMSGQSPAFRLRWTLREGPSLVLEDLD
jgi:hypothetical protein